jgi:hypothetical protein
LIKPPSEDSDNEGTDEEEREKARKKGYTDTPPKWYWAWWENEKQFEKSKALL